MQLLDALRWQPAPEPAARIGAEKHQMADALGIAHGIFDGDGAALRMAEQREALEARRVDHRLEVAHIGIEREVAHFPV